MKIKKILKSRLRRPPSPSITGDYGMDYDITRDKDIHLPLSSPIAPALRVCHRFAGVIDLIFVFHRIDKAHTAKQPLTGRNI